MTDDWRIFLYPLGALSSIAFGGRFLLQWIQSELRQQSIVNRSFWKLSLAGNALLWIHCVVQLQIHVCVIQMFNGIIAWRNLNLMQPKHRRLPLATVFLFMAIGTVLTTALFVAQQPVDDILWMRIPTLPGTSAAASVSPLWHAIGSLGIVLYSIRFWIQWWQAERQMKSYLGPLFWWTSIAGATVTVVYFIRIFDVVNVIGPLLGMIPYVRNLILLRRNPHVGSQST